MEPIYVEVGKNLRKLRQDAGMTQRQLGDTIGISASRISSYERAVSRPKLHIIEDMAYALGYTLKIDFTRPRILTHDADIISGGLIQ